MGSGGTSYHVLVKPWFKPLGLVGHLGPLDTTSYGCQDGRRSSEPVCPFQALFQQQSQPPSATVDAAYCIAFRIVQEQTGAMRPSTCQPQERESPGPEPQDGGVEKL